MAVKEWVYVYIYMYIVIPPDVRLQPSLFGRFCLFVCMFVVTLAREIYRERAFSFFFSVVDLLLLLLLMLLECVARGIGWDACACVLGGMRARACVYV